MAQNISYCCFRKRSVIYFQISLSCINGFCLDPADIYLFKVNNRKLEKGAKYVQSYQ